MVWRVFLITAVGHQRSLLDAFAQQMALALDRLQLRELMAEAKLLAESERLSKTLLNSIAHEIRTPLAVIEAASSSLFAFQPDGMFASQRVLLAEIREATERLNRLVGNVLAITRLESGHVKPRLDFHDVRELVNTALAESRKTLVRHKVTCGIQLT